MKTVNLYIIPCVEKRLIQFFQNWRQHFDDESETSHGQANVHEWYEILRINFIFQYFFLIIFTIFVFLYKANFIFIYQEHGTCNNCPS